MDYNFNTRLKGNLTLTSDFHANQALRKDKTLYKFIWVQNGTITLEIDHIDITLGKDELISLTPLHHIEFKEINGTYLTLYSTAIFTVFTDTTRKFPATDSCSTEPPA